MAYFKSKQIIFLAFTLCQLFKRGLTADDPDPVTKDINDDVDNHGFFNTDQGDRLNRFLEINLPIADSLDVDYFLFTPLNPATPYKMNSSKYSLDSSNFNPDLDTKYLIHGYYKTLNFPNDIKFVTKDAILAEGRYNVFVMNYTEYTRRHFYTEATKYSFVVGQNLANFIQFLMTNTGIDESKFHLIGHGLGAHVAAVAGSIVPDMARITGLDTFRLHISDFNYRRLQLAELNPKSAKFVDVIHTTPSGIGGRLYYDNVGHQDFFPNGGDDQPGCSDGDTWMNHDLTLQTVNSSSSKVQCNHQRAEMLFLASIFDCEFLGVNCDSYDDYNSGSCAAKNSVVAKMGYPANQTLDTSTNALKSKKYFYLNTTGEAPFCKSPDEPDNILDDLDDLLHGLDKPSKGSDKCFLLKLIDLYDLIYNFVIHTVRNVKSNLKTGLPLLPKLPGLPLLPKLLGLL